MSVILLLAYFLWTHCSPFCHLPASVSFMANLVKPWPFPTHHHIQEELVVCRAQTCDRRGLSMWVSNPPSWAWGEDIPWCFTVSTWLHFTTTLHLRAFEWCIWSLAFQDFSYYCLDVIQRKVIFFAWKAFAVLLSLHCGVELESYHRASLFNIHSQMPDVFRF